MRKVVVALAFWFPFSVALAADVSLPFDTATAQFKDVPRQQVFDGVIEAVHQSTVSAQTAGRITEIAFDVDDYVEKGEVLLRFRDNEPRARLAAAEANLNEAQARLAQAEKEYARVESVYEQKLVSKSAMDAATAELKSARARLAATRAGVEEAREQLEHTVVRAPYSGIVVKRHVEVGESASPGQPLMSGLSLEKLRATVALPQQFVQQVRATGRAFLHLPDSRQVEAESVVVFPYADSVSHTFRVRLGLPTGLTELYPGMMVKIGFVTDQDKRLVVPVQAVVYRSEVTGLYVVSPNGTVSLRQVRLGRSHEGGIEVLAGLEAGETVALDPIRAGAYLKEQWAAGSS